MEQQKPLVSAQDVAFFQKTGYWVSPVVIGSERLAELIAHMDRVYEGQFETGRSPWPGYWQPGGNPQALRRTVNASWSDRILHALATDPVIGAMAAALMQADCIRFWHDQLLYKPGRGTGRESEKANVGWHQDWSYWQNCLEPSLVTAWIAFADTDENNGCMQVVPGSNRWGLVKISDFFDQDLQRQQRDIEHAAGRAFRPQPVPLKAGQISFHHALTIHGSGPNRSDTPRRSLAVHLMTGNTRYKKFVKDHMNVLLMREDGAQLNEGDLFAGKHFPVLYPQAE